jgi:integrase
MAGLSDLRARNIKPGERLADGTIDGLHLICDATPGVGRWELRFKSPVTRKTRYMGLGGYPLVGVAAARKAGFEAREEIAKGLDPIEEKRRPKPATASAAAAAVRKPKRPAVPTFAEVALPVIQEAEARTKNAKVAYQWRHYLGPAYCAPLHPLRIDKVTTVDVADALRPIWKTKPEIARKTLPMIRRVMDRARIIARDRHGITIGDPCVWRDLKAMGFEAPEELSRGHMPSLPYLRVPAFVIALRERDAIAARMMELLILTNVRTGAVIGAQWDQFDLDGGVWTVPVEYLKDSRTRREAFRVPLSPRAVEIVREMAAIKMSAYVFPGRGQSPLSNMAMLTLLKRMNRADEWLDKEGKKIVPHGFRSSFRVWAEETTPYPNAVIEEAMGHVVGSKVERAYRRTDVLDQRRALMDEWATFCGSSRV